MISKILRSFFKLLYHQFAWGYDVVAAAVSLGRWKPWVLSVLPDIQGPTVLEIGPGPGHLLIAMARQGLCGYGLDESWQMLKLVKRKVLGEGVKASVVNGYAQFMPFPSSHFNTLVATFPTEYFLDPHFLDQAFRVLSPGGRLLVLPVAWITGHGWVDRLAAWLFHTTGQDSLGDRLYHPALLQAGFTVRVEEREISLQQAADYPCHKALNVVKYLHGTSRRGFESR